MNEAFCVQDCNISYITESRGQGIIVCKSFSTSGEEVLAGDWGNFNEYLAFSPRLHVCSTEVKRCERIFMNFEMEHTKASAIRQTKRCHCVLQCLRIGLIVAGFDLLQQVLLTIDGTSWRSSVHFPQDF